MAAGDLAWISLGAVVVAWDASCAPGQTLSEAMGRYHTRRPWLTRAVVVLLALHLLDVLPGWCDPIHAATTLKKRRRRNHATTSDSDNCVDAPSG